MIQLTRPPLSPGCLASLAQYQQEIDSLPAYSEQVAQAKAIWPARKHNKPFQEVTDALISMCSGARRCHYCEDSAADEIEHFRPKHIFPDRTFVWENYLYACGPCNGPKSNQFAHFTGTAAPRSQVDLETQALAAVPAGDPLLIDPSTENPLDFLLLELNPGPGRTLYFVPRDPDPASESNIRASYTIKVLRLNKPFLCEAREKAYGNYTSRLESCLARHTAGTSQDVLDRMIRGIQQEQHPTVWKEMQRQQARIPELADLFSRLPQALSW